MAISINYTNSTRRAYDMAYRYLRMLSCEKHEFSACTSMKWEGAKRVVENLRANHADAVEAAERTMDARWTRPFEPVSPRFVVKTEIVGYFIPVSALIAAGPDDWLY